MNTNKSTSTFKYSFFTTALIIFFQFFYSPAKASHVVGGEINYECLGGNQYRIFVRAYRDCSGINFPDPARVDVYNSAGTKLQTISIPLPATVTLTPTPPGPCTEVPTGVCVEAVEYITTVSLPPIPGGYLFEYNDCCRNGGIVNGPAGSSSYTAKIPDISVATCNSNPKFINWPPVFVCQNVPLSIDHSAIDVDGDDLVYSICTANESLNGTYPYSAPYTAADPLNGGVSIDPQTGLLTGTPPDLGRFVLGVCVSEYRNGQLISTTTRDFQFNVVECTEVAVASALTALTNCNTFEVSFFNSSLGGTSYLWDFGDGNTSTQFEPVHSYGSVGNYNVTLIAFAANPICNDTMTSLVAVADTCRPCGMNVNVTTVDGVCNPANGCYQVQWIHPCSSSSSVSYNGSSSSGGCGGSTSLSGGSAPNYSSVSASVDGVALPSGATTENLTYLGPASPCTASLSTSYSGGNKIITFNAVYTEPQTGGASVNITGGNPGYNVQWTTTPIRTGTNITGVDPGAYTVIVTDINGCVEVVNFAINGNATFNLTASGTDPTSCTANDGTLSANVTGATGTVLYSWQPGGYTTANVNNVPPGTYTVTAIDDNNCSKSAVVTINEVTTINVSANPTDVVCFGDLTGTATVVPATGGTGPYSYSWNTFPTPSTGTSISNLGKGFYTVTATDQNGCQGQYSFTVNGPLPLTFNGTTNDASCFNVADGSATVAPTGGNGGYTYSWSPSGGTGATASGLLGGTYTVTVTDAQSCSADTTLTINRPPVLDADIVDNSTIDCAGNFVGNVEVFPVGGTQKVNNPVPVFTEPFNTPTSPQWSTSGDLDWTTWAVVSGVFTGQNVDQEAVWTSTCIDISNCTNPVLTLDASSANADPTGDRFQVFYRLDGGPEVLLLDLHDENDIANYPTFASLTGNIPNGGCVEIIIKVQMSASNEMYYFDNVVVSCVPNVFSPYDYSWTCTGATTAAVTSLPLGLCTVTVTDGNGCTVQDTITIIDPGVLSTSVTGQDACGGSNDGAATALTTGGTPPYSYAWSCSPDNSPSISGLATGTTCNLTVTDAIGCTATGLVNIGNFPAVTLDTIIDLGTCNNDASIDLTVTSGTGPYTYTWSTGETTEDISGLASDSTYKVTVWDNNNCFDTLNAYISVITCGPEITLIGDTICVGETGTLTATGTAGTLNYTFDWSGGGITGNSDNGTIDPTTVTQTDNPTTTTTYTVLITDNNGDTASTTAQIIVNPLPVVVATLDTAICIGASANVMATGASTYVWDNGLPATAGPHNVSPITTTTYTVTGTDAN
ncbi:MAG: hypothetical protein J5I47_05940, partial [Vicingus serpentipes]|nr:hypothetical protein [Vicingus serpentipes]